MLNLVKFGQYHSLIWGKILKYLITDKQTVITQQGCAAPAQATWVESGGDVR
jgi:hypothetical protein